MNIVNKLFIAINIICFGVTHYATAANDVGMPQLDGSSYIGQIFWLIIFFTILYVVATRKILPQYSDVINIRAQRIASDIKQAEDNNKEAEQIQNSLADDIKSAYSTADSITFQEREKVMEKMIDERQQKEEAAAAQIEEAHQALLMAQKNVESQLDGLANTVAQKMVKQILKQDCDDSTLKSYIDKASTAFSTNSENKEKS